MSSASAFKADRQGDCQVVAPASFIVGVNDLLHGHTETGSTVVLTVLKILQTERFSSVLGLLAAEEMLRRCIAKLRLELDDRAVVFRLGGDKLGIVLFDIRNEGHARLAANKIQRLISAPLVASGKKFRLSCVQGLSIFPTHAKSAESLFRGAETALEIAQETGAKVQVHDPNNQSRQGKQWELEQLVEVALSDGDILVALQPKVDLTDGSIKGAEALLRIADSEVSPASFIDIAEHSGRLFDVTSVILNAALRHASEWRKSGHATGVSVNVTPSIIRSPECIDLVRDALSIWTAPENSLTLEITESTFLEDPETCFFTLDELRNMGVRISIDDFGTGFSSLSYFKHMPADELKIDRSFVTTMLSDTANGQIVRAVIALAHAFQLDVVAEGVEDQATLDALKALGCDLIQGYYLTEPLLPDDYMIWQRDWEAESKFPGPPQTG